MGANDSTITSLTFSVDIEDNDEDDDEEDDEESIESQGLARSLFAELLFSLGRARKKALDREIIVSGTIQKRQRGQTKLIQGQATQQRDHFEAADWNVERLTLNRHKNLIALSGSDFSTVACRNSQFATVTLLFNNKPLVILSCLLPFRPRPPPSPPVSSSPSLSLSPLFCCYCNLFFPLGASDMDIPGDIADMVEGIPLKTSARNMTQLSNLL